MDMTTMMKRTRRFDSARLLLAMVPFGAAVSACRGDDPDATTSETTAADSEGEGGTGLASSSSSGPDGEDGGDSSGDSTTEGTSGAVESSSTGTSSETGTETTGDESLPLPEACAAGCDVFAGCAGQDVATCVTGCSASGDLGPECAEATAVAMTCVSTSNCDDIYLDCGAELELAQMACQGGIDPPQPG